MVTNSRKLAPPARTLRCALLPLCRTLAWGHAICGYVAMRQVVPEAAVVTDSRKLARTASSAPPVDLRRLLGYVGEDPLGGAADSRPVSAKDEARNLLAISSVPCLTAVASHLPFAALGD